MPQEFQKQDLPEMLLARKETRFRGTSPVESNLQDETIQASNWSEPWNTTMYLGDPQLDQPFPQPGTSRGRIRIRFHTEQAPQGEAVVYDLTQNSILEIKTHGTHTKVSGKKTKYQVTMPLGDAIKYLQNLDDQELGAELDSTYAKGWESEGRTFSQALKYFAGDKVTSVAPIGATEYYRQEFRQDKQNRRITVDTDLRYRAIGQEHGIWYGLHLDYDPETSVEIKQEIGSNTIPSEVLEVLFGKNHDYTLAEDIAKFNHLRELVNTYDIRPKRKNFEMDYSGVQAKEWIGRERERKIDLKGADACDAIHKLDEIRTDEISIGPAKSRHDFEYFFKIDEETGITVMSNTPDFERPRYKAKCQIPNEDGDVINEEIVSYSLDEVLNTMNISKDSQTNQTPSFIRQRVLRHVVCPESGNVFVVVGDHCIAEDERSPLDQVEIEYLGKLTLDPEGPHLPNSKEIYLNQIRNDFDTIESFLISQFDSEQIEYDLTSKTKKYTWINEQNVNNSTTIFDATE